MTPFPPASIDADVESWLGRLGTVFARFDATSQDSGNVSYGVEIDGERWFVKTAGLADDPAGDGFDSRVTRLRNGAELARSVQHRALPRFAGVVESPSGPALVYAWVDGELLHAPTERRADPDGAPARFRSLPVPQVLEVALELDDVHVALASAGWVAGDLYTGCLIYDGATARLTVVDLDHYTRGATTNTMGRMYGSTRLMPPEELTLGATIDERSTVFTLARLALTLLGDETMSRAAFRGPPALLAVIDRATATDPADRYQDVASYAAAVRTAVGR